jgi:hypothetical protein
MIMNNNTGINDNMENFAQSAYQAYGECSGWKGLRGETLLQWDLLQPTQQRVWFGVASAVMERSIIAPKYTKVLLAEHIVPFTTR